jgi:FkbM family methyltransferase
MSVKSDLIYDIGLHKGEDTDFYLRKGFSVVAIEANPVLAANARRRFQNEIASGRLRLIEGAIAPASTSDKIVFYINSNETAWGTIEAKWALRNETLGYASKLTEVSRIEIGEVYRSFGIPFYLKIDVEGVDRLVVEELRAFRDRPQYLSLESDKEDFNQLKYEMDLLASLGYKKFKVVQQQGIPGKKIQAQTRNGEAFEYVFDRDASGPFGDDLPDPWLTYDQAIEVYKSVFRRYELFGDYSLVIKMPAKVQRLVHWFYRKSTGYIGPLPGWFDTHASL